MWTAHCDRPWSRVAAGALAALALLAAGAAPARADRAAVFTVANVRVDVTAETAAQARDRALAEGQRRAFERLVRRLVRQDDVGRVPKPGDPQLAGLVQGLEIADEKTSTVRYLASLTVRFHPTAVTRLLEAAGIPFAETKSRPVVVLPVWIADGTALLWEDSNAWRQAWAALPPRDGLVPMVVPFGDLSDIATVSTEQALAGEPDRLSELARRYEAGDVVVATAERKPGLGEDRPRLDLAVTRYGSVGRETTLVDSVVGEAGEDMGALLARAVDRIAAEIEATWKRDNLVTPSVESRLEVTVRFAGLQDWLGYRRQLADVAIVRRFRLIELSRDTARVGLWIVGDSEKLRLALAQRDLDLSYDAGEWMLGRRGAVAKPTE